MKTIQLLTFLLLSTMYSCSSVNSKQQNSKVNEIVEPDADALPELQFVTDPNEKQILSATDTLFRGDTLKISFKTPHFKDLAITTPDNKFFFVVYGFNDTTKPSLVDWNEFANLDYLEIISDKTKVNPWNADISENQIVFSKTGMYEIRLSKNLETDDGTPVEVESVYYIDKTRRK